MRIARRVPTPPPPLPSRVCVSREEEEEVEGFTLGLFALSLQARLALDGHVLVEPFPLLPPRTLSCSETGFYLPEVPQQSLRGRRSGLDVQLGSHRKDLQTGKNVDYCYCKDIRSSAAKDTELKRHMQS
jgi:hypothetical protein